MSTSLERAIRHYENLLPEDFETEFVDFSNDIRSPPPMKRYIYPANRPCSDEGTFREPHEQD